MSTSDNPKPSLTQRLVNTEGIPQDVKMSYLLWVIGAFLSIVAAAFILISPSTPLGVGIIGLLFALLFAGLYIYFALRMKEGAAWARMVLTVLASLSAAGIVVNMLSGNFGFNLLGPIIAVIATILMWSRNARPWFNRYPPVRR
ncbi:hypothetical protein [Arthrobacter sp. H14]|uniref:hypothetical protein n=1 Tax=Arthrobacter sp. H14 TaxID=1312959 RepID=UPI0004B54644|nr:hypothetical protein [Arthrobacter sp. H14]